MRRPRIGKKLTGDELLTYGMRLLAGRALSTEELRLRLQNRAAEPLETETVMDRLKQYGFVDDARFAEHLATGKRDSGSGPQKVLRDLRQRRVSSNLASEAVSSAFQGVDEVQMVRDWLQRKFRNIPLAEYLQEQKHVASVYRKLIYAGFSASSVLRVLREYSERASELADGPDETEEE